MTCLTSRTAQPRPRGLRAIGALLAMVALVAVAFAVPAQAFATQSDVPGALVGWGYNMYGKFSTPAGLNGRGKTAVLGRDATSIVAGLQHTLALTEAGELVAWGNNEREQLDVPSELKRIDENGEAHDGKTVTAIAAGERNSLALTKDGKVYAWGQDDYGQSTVPTVLDDKIVTAIASSGYHSLALTEDGKVYAWGENNHDQLNVPAELDGKTVTDIAASGWHSLALTSEGKVYAWGSNANGQTDVPAELDGKTVTAIAAGTYNSLALTSDGKVYAWGSNYYGQNDVPSELDDEAVTKISAPHGIGEFALALAEGGKVFGWGNDLYDQATAPDFLDEKTVTAIAAGAGGSLVLVAREPLPTTILADRERVHAGDTVGVTVGVTNPNIDGQRLDSLTISIPDGFTYVEDSSTGPEPTVDGNTLTFENLGTLDADGGKLILDGQTDPGLDFELRAVGAGAGDAKVLPGQTASGTEVLSQQAHLIADVPLPTTITPDPEQIPVGDTTTLTVGVTNPNIDEQTLEELTFAIPEGFEYVSDDSAGDHVLSEDGRTLTFTDLGTLDANGGELSFNLELRAVAMVPTRGTVEVTSGHTDKDVHVETSDADLIVLVALPTTITPDPEQIPVGDTSSLTVSVTNPNLTSQQLDSLTLAIPEGFEYVSDDAAGDHLLSEDGRTLTFTNLGTLDANGGELSFNLELRAVAMVPTRGTVEVTSGHTDKGADVETSDADLIILVPLDTTIATDPDQILVGDTTTITVGVTNPNLTDQQVGSLSVSIPEGIEYVDDSSSIAEPEKSDDGRTLTFTNLGTLDANGGELTFTFELKAEAAQEGFVGVDPGETPIGLPILPSSVELTAVEPEVPSNGELPQTGDGTGPAAVVALAAGATLATGATLTLARRLF